MISSSFKPFRAKKPQYLKLLIAKSFDNLNFFKFSVIRIKSTIVNYKPIVSFNFHVISDTNGKTKTNHQLSKPKKHHLMTKQLNKKTKKDNKDNKRRRNKNGKNKKLLIRRNVRKKMLLRRKKKKGKRKN